MAAQETEAEAMAATAVAASGEAGTGGPRGSTELAAVAISPMISPLSPLLRLGGSLDAGAPPSPSEALSPDAQALHDRIVALQLRLSRSLVTHGEPASAFTPRS